MAKSTTKKNVKQCTLDFWRQQTPPQQAQTVPMATNCSHKQEADEALKQIFGHEAYKSDVQRKAVSAILTGLFRVANFQKRTGYRTVACTVKSWRYHRLPATVPSRLVNIIISPRRTDPRLYELWNFRSQELSLPGAKVP